MTYSITDAGPLDWGQGWDSFKLGEQGWPVIVAQVCINSHFKVAPLVLDGFYGPASDKAGRELQAACKVAVDGHLGPKTQEAFVRAKMKHAEVHMTPPGLLVGICGMESSYFWPSVSPVNSNGTSDYFVTQASLTPAEATEHALLAWANPDTAGHLLAGEVAGFHKAIASKAPTNAWELAALYHNWPAAAWALAEGRQAWLDKPFAFTTAKGYDTGLDYANYYIAKATEQVTSWTVV